MQLVEKQPSIACVPLRLEVWLRLLAAIPDASPFQTPQWMDGICLDGRYRDESLLYVSDAGSMAVLLAARRIAPGISAAAALPHGMGAGGLLADQPLTEELLQPVLDDLRKRPYASILIRPNPLHSEHLRSCVFPGWVTRQLKTHVMDLSGGFDDVSSQCFTTRRRRHVKKALGSGLELRSGNDPGFVKAFYDLYLKWCEGKAGKKGIPASLARMTGSRREPFWKFRNAAQAASDKLSIHLAFLNDVPVAGAVMLIDGNSAVYWRGASDLDLSPAVRGNDFIQHHLIKSACEAGCTYYHMGESGGVSSLEEFKESFGARAYRYVEFVHQKPWLKVGSDVKGALVGFAERRLAQLRSP